jgi:hypothetical protein
MQAMLPAYQHHFTHGEIQQLISFYSSPVGKKLLTEMPAILSEYMPAAMPVIQRWQTANMAELKSSAEDYAKALKAKKAASGSSAAPADSTPASLLQPLYPH